jgi:hypothetical protein
VALRALSPEFSGEKCALLPEGSGVQVALRAQLLALFDSATRISLLRRFVKQNVCYVTCL